MSTEPIVTKATIRRVMSAAAESGFPIKAFLVRPSGEVVLLTAAPPHATDATENEDWVALAGAA
jgi:hypothetical protein